MTRTPPRGHIALTLGTACKNSSFALIPGLLLTALKSTPDLFDLASQEPGAASSVLDQAEAAILEQVATEQSESRNIAYVLGGAHDPVSTPMQYGGFILERERQLLERIAPGGPDLLVIVGPDPYLDFVSDLPAKIFAWNSQSGTTAAELRNLREGILASDQPEADITLPADQIAELEAWGAQYRS